VSSEIGGADLALSGTVRLGTPDGFGTFFLAPRIGHLAAQYPDLEIQLVAMPRSSRCRSARPTWRSRSRPRRRARSSRGSSPITARALRVPSLSRPPPPDRRADDLHAHEMIGYIDDLIFTPELDYLDEVSKGLRPRLQSSNLLAQMQATLAGGGICVLPHFLAVQDPRLVPVLPQAVAIIRSFWLIVHADLKDVARIRATMDFVVREVRAARALFMP
jgi:DNA-binding transcriptional LysR family regulator